MFCLELPDDLTLTGPHGPLAGTVSTRPKPPLGVRQRRLTFTEEYPNPGVCPPRHWPRSTPEGQQIFFLMRDGDGKAQLWSIRPEGGDPKKVTQAPQGISSTFTVSADGQWVCYISDGRVMKTSVDGHTTRILTAPSTTELAPRPRLALISPDGQRIAYVRRVAQTNQIFVV